MTMPISPAPAPASASAGTPSAAADTNAADGSGANGSFGSVFDAATKSPDKTAAESPGTAQTKKTDDKADKPSDDTDASAAATAAALPMMPQAAVTPHAVPVPPDAAPGNRAASSAAIKGGTRSSASAKTAISASTAVTGSGAPDADAASATTAATALRPPSSAGGPSTHALISQAANALDADAGHRAHDAKDLTAALATTSSASGPNPLPPPGTAATALAIHGGVQTPPPNAPAAVQHIAAPVGSVPWHDEVAHGLLHVITLHQQHAELHVNPPHMGPIDVHIHVAADQAAVTFTAAHPDTRAALEQAMPRLRDMLSGQGIFLGQAAVQSDSRPRQRPAQDQRAPRRIAAAGAVAASSPIRVVHYFARSDRIVDTFA